MPLSLKTIGSAGYRDQWNKKFGSVQVNRMLEVGGRFRRAEFILGGGDCKRESLEWSVIFKILNLSGQELQNSPKIRVSFKMIMLLYLNHKSLLMAMMYTDGKFNSSVVEKWPKIAHALLPWRAPSLRKDGRLYVAIIATELWPKNDTTKPFSSYFDVIISLGFCNPGARFSIGPVTFHVRRQILKSKAVEQYRSS